MVTQFSQSNAFPSTSLSSPLRILVVEDDPETAHLIRYLLERRGYEVVELYSGTEALELIAAVERGEGVPFDVALLDIMLPYVNGYEICQEIRRTERLGYIPIILVTALNSTEDMVRGLGIGADDYLVKPFNPRELVARVRAAVRIRDMDQAMRQRNWQLAMLNALNDAIGGSLDGDEVLRAALNQLLQRLDLSYAVAFLLDRRTGDVARVLYCDGERWVEERIADSTDAAEDTGGEMWQEQGAYQLALDVITSDRRRLQTEVRGWPALPEQQGPPHGWRACVSLRTKPPNGFEQARASPAEPTQRVLGALLVGASADKPIVDLDLLTAVGNQIGQALEKQHLFQDLAVAYANLESSRHEILASRNRLQALFDGISDILYVVDDEYRIAALNAALGQWLAKQGRVSSLAAGGLSESVVGQICFQTLYGREEPCQDCQIAYTLRTGQSRQWTAYRRQSAGSREEWEMNAYPIRGWQNGTSQAIILARDVTAQRMLEASLGQSEKLASLGQLAAGLAHEINNPLTAIVANVQLLLTGTAPGDPNYESLDLIKQASERAVKVVRNLLDFARQEQYEFQPTDINASLRAALELVSHQFLISQVTVAEDLAPDLAFALASRDHLQGVWLNLLLNARDAVTQHARAEGERRVYVGSRARDDGSLEVTITDNGAGIPPEQLKRVFEPFFTTKDPGKGTGLGLSTSYHIIKQHGGEIQVDSKIGAGTTFTVLLPAPK